MLSQGCLAVNYCKLKAPAGELVGNKNPLLEKNSLFLASYWTARIHRILSKSIASARTQRSLCPNLRVELQQLYLQDIEDTTEKLSTFDTYYLWKLLLNLIMWEAIYIYARSIYPQAWQRSGRNMTCSKILINWKVFKPNLIIFEQLVLAILHVHWLLPSPWNC